MRNLVVLATILVGSMGYSVKARADDSHSFYGSVHVAVIDQHGLPVDDAPVYIYGRSVPDRQDLRGGDTLQLAEGDYDFSAAWVQRTEEGIIPQLSPMAHVHVTPGDTAFVILPLTFATPQRTGEFVGPLAFSSR